MRGRQISTSRTPFGTAGSETPLWVEEAWGGTTDSCHVREWSGCASTGGGILRAPRHTLVGTDSAGCAVALFAPNASHQELEAWSREDPARRHVKASAILLHDYFGTGVAASVRLMARANYQKGRFTLSEYGDIVSRAQEGQTPRVLAALPRSLAERWASDSDSADEGISASIPVLLAALPATTPVKPSLGAPVAQRVARSLHRRVDSELVVGCKRASDDAASPDAVSVSDFRALVHKRWAPGLDVGRRSQRGRASDSKNKNGGGWCTLRPWCHYTLKVPPTGAPLAARRPGAVVFRPEGFTLAEIAEDVAIATVDAHKTGEGGGRVAAGFQEALVCIGARRVVTMLRALARNATVEALTLIVVATPKPGIRPKIRARGNSRPSPRELPSTLEHRAASAAKELASPPTWAPESVGASLGFDSIAALGAGTPPRTPQRSSPPRRSPLRRRGDGDGGQRPLRSSSSGGSASANASAGGGDFSLGEGRGRDADDRIFSGIGLHARFSGALRRVTKREIFYGTAAAEAMAVATPLTAPPRRSVLRGADCAIGARAVLWLRSSGAAALAVRAGAGYYAGLCARVNDVVCPRELDAATAKTIARDVPRTLPASLTDVQREQLERVLRCYALRSHRTVGCVLTAAQSRCSIPLLPHIYISPPNCTLTRTVRSPIYIYIGLSALAPPCAPCISPLVPPLTHARARSLLFYNMLFKPGRALQLRPGHEYSRRRRTAQ